MKVSMLVLVILLTGSSYAHAEICANPLAGKWTCDTDMFGTKVDILVAPPSHGVSNGALIVVDSDKDQTVLTAPLDGVWTSGDEFYPVKTTCPGGTEAVVKVIFKDRPINFRKAAGSFIFFFETDPLNPQSTELHIYDDVKFKDGSNYTLNATCRARP